MQDLPISGQKSYEMTDRVRDLIRGRNNSSGSVTLTANQASTTVSNEFFSDSAGVFLFPTTANAAAEIGAGTMYASVNAGGGSFTIVHANNALTDRTFQYVVLGG